MCVLGSLSACTMKFNGLLLALSLCSFFCRYNSRQRKQPFI